MREAKPDTQSTRVARSILLRGNHADVSTMVYYSYYGIAVIWQCEAEWATRPFTEIEVVHEGFLYTRVWHKVYGIRYCVRLARRMLEDVHEGKV